MDGLVSPARRRVVACEDRRHGLSTLEDGLGRKITEVLSFTGIKIVAQGTQISVFHRAAIALVTAIEPRHLAVSHVPDVAMSQ